MKNTDKKTTESAARGLVAALVLWMAFCVVVATQIGK